MAFYVGQKVVCVDAVPLPGLRFGTPLTKGAVYTIASTGEFSPHNGRECIRLVEIKQSAPYEARRFRPVIERKTDISIFTEMLKPKQRELIEG